MRGGIEDGMKEGGQSDAGAAVVLGSRWWEKEGRMKLKRARGGQQYSSYTPQKAAASPCARLA
jgi:hypothetical protein